jgi:phosphodiesterase/alkaline phosphatase D-like protein
MRKIVLISLVMSIAVVATAWAETTPAVVTGSATAVSNSGAVLHATVNPGGGTTAYNFQYGPTTAYGAYSTTSHATGTAAVPITKTLAGLTPGTLYHYEIEATNKLGASVGRDRTFTTTGHPPPSAATGVASAVTTMTATLTGSVVTNGQTTSFYFEYGPSTSYGYQTAAQNVTAVTTPAASAVSATLTDLSPGTTIHYRLVAVHTGVIPEYGADEALTTVPLVRFHAKVTASTTPSRARHKPYLFTTSGTVVSEVALAPGYGCSGLVNVRFSLGRKAVAFRKVTVQPNCSYATSVGFRHLVDHTKTRLRVQVKFRGNSYLRPASAKARQVRLG